MIDSLTLDQMRILVAVADAGSFSAAARKLGRVQSAISQSIQTLERTLGLGLFDRSGKTPQLTDAGKALVGDARTLIAAARAIRARAESMAQDVEPELTLAVDAMLPIPLLMESLKALRVAFPLLPASVYTEALGGAEQRLRDGAARLAICTIAPSSPCDLVSEFMTRVAMWPVVAASHPLAALPLPLTREALEPHVQLVLTDRTPLTHNLSGGIVSRHIWRFADLATRLDFLLGGFGWCNMPSHMVAEHVAAGRLKRLQIANQEEIALPLSVVHERGRLPGRAGRWLIADLRERLKTCPGAHHPEERMAAAAVAA
ncbi:MAG TPA: LysR family transcriptional regulator [Roseiarcus sp.]|jgi:DNA-binding transcriptional LysR family regulator